MSCAHSFGEWCPECCDGLVQDYNRLCAEVARLSRVEQALRGELDAANQHVKIMQAERDRLYHEGADAHRALIAVKADLLRLNIDGVTVWESWLDKDVRERAEAVLSASPEAQPKEER